MKKMLWVAMAWGCFSSSAWAQAKVTTYVVKTQEERENTRWTLTEWLHIKERMKLMDVWLAMFSNPQKDKFSPELNLSYSIRRGEFTHSGQSADTQAAQLKGQLWLTNLISSTFGVRTLNIDFGGEGFLQRSEGSSGSTSVGVNYSGHSPHVQYGTANFRIFGKNIQDSSLVLKYGQYRRDGHFGFLTAAGMPSSYRGIVAGAEMNLYVFKWLGLEGNYLSFGDTKRLGNDASREGTYYDYMAYIEISLIRFMGGYYHEEWRTEAVGVAYNTHEKGMLAGLKLQF